MYLSLSMIPLIVFVIIVLTILIRQVNQYERGVKFTFGKFTGVVGPGWRLVIPVFQSLTKVDMRLKAVDVPDQRTITRDNIPVNVNAVLYYKVVEADKAILEIERFYAAVEQYAQTTMRNIVGEVTLDELLQNENWQQHKIWQRQHVFWEKLRVRFTCVHFSR